MRNALFLAILTTTFSVLYSQAPAFTTYSISNSGCKIDLPATPDFELSYSEDSSEVWTADVADGNLRYSIICIRFRESIAVDDVEYLPALLESYLDFLQGQLDIVTASSTDEGAYDTQTYEEGELYGVLDYWEDSDMLLYSISGLINSDYLTVAMVYGEEDAPEDLCTTFFQSVHFPE